MSAKKELTEALRNPWMRAALLLVLIAVAATAALGGFRKATAATGASRLPVYGAGATIETGAMAITPIKAWRTLREPGRYATDEPPKHQYLVLRVRVENQIPETVNSSLYLGQDLLWLETRDGKVAGEKKAERFRRADEHGTRSLTADLHPGLPLTVDMVWELPLDTPLQAQQQWGILGRAFKAKLTFYGASGWGQQDPVAKLRLAVEDRRNPVLAP